MRSAYVLAVAFTVLAMAAPPSARLSAAQSADVYHEGLAHTALGAATVSLDPLTHLLPISNIGSSGNDGVEIKWAKAARGVAFELPDADAEFSTPGCVHTIVVRGTVAGAPATVGTLAVRRDSDGGETLMPAFPTSSGSNVWFELLGASGNVVYTTCCKPTYDVKANKKVVAASARNSIESGGGRGIAVDIRIPESSNFSITVSYPVAMIVREGTNMVECRAVRFTRMSGPAVSSFGPVSIKGMWPVGTGTGSFTIAAEPVTPPCAGLDCPNGPGTQLSVGETGLYDQGSSSDTEMRVAPKDTTKIRLRESPSKGSLGTARPPTKGLSFEIRLRESPTLHSSLLWRAEGTVDGVPDQELCAMSCDASGGQVQYVPDFSTFGLTSYHVMLSNGGSPVADITDPIGGFTVLTSSLDDAIEVARTASGPRIIRNCRTPPCPGEPVIVAGAVYVADHIEIEGLDGSGTFSRTISDMTALEVSSYDAITIYGGYADPVTPVTGVEARATALDFAAPVLSPNPAMGRVHVKFELPRAARTQVSVIDLLGRRVRSLADADFAAGAHDLSWDGSNETGGRVPAGVYFLRVESGSASRVTRMTRLW